MAIEVIAVNCCMHAVSYMFTTTKCVVWAEAQSIDLTTSQLGFGASSQRFCKCVDKSTVGENASWRVSNSCEESEREQLQKRR